MKLTSKEIEFFKSLNQTEISSNLVSYLERLCNHICDSRNWESLGVKDATIANSAEKVLKQFVIEKLNQKRNNTKPSKYEYE